MFTHVQNVELPDHLIKKDIIDESGNITKKIKVNKTSSLSKDQFFIEEGIENDPNLKFKKCNNVSKRINNDNLLEHLKYRECEVLYINLIL